MTDTTDITAPTVLGHPLHDALIATLDALTPTCDLPAQFIHSALTTVVERHRPIPDERPGSVDPWIVCLECASLMDPPDEPATAWTDEVYPCGTVRGIAAKLWLTVEALPELLADRFAAGVDQALLPGETLDAWAEH